MVGSKCNSCGAQYQQIKMQCPNCGAPIATAYAQPRAYSKSGMSPLLKAGLIVAAIFFSVIVLLPLLLGIGSSFFSSDSSDDPPAVTQIIQEQPVNFDGNVTINAKIEGGSKPTVIGETNLPTGTTLLVTLSNERERYTAQSSIRVGQGKFAAGPFTYNNQPVYPGKYTATISMPMVEAQPDSLRTLFGENGSRLKGPHVKSEKIGASHEYNSVELVVSATIEAGAEDHLIQRGDWQYSTDIDELSKKPFNTAILRSANSFNLSRPYDGTQYATLMLRNHPKNGQDIVFFIERGQIMCQSYGDCSVEIAFDDKPDRTVQGNEPASRDSTTVFLPNYSRLSREIASAKEMRIRVTLFNQPSVTAVFRTDGLDLKKL